MVLTEQIVQAMEIMAPSEIAEPWDNVGLLVNCDIHVNAVLCALDITKEVVEEAVENECNFIISHHPVIFSPIKKIENTSIEYMLVKNNISALCAHTNLDAAENGVNTALVERLGLVNTENFATGGRIGFLNHAMLCGELAQKCAEILYSDYEPQYKACVQFADAEKVISKVAVMGGSGKSYIKDAIAMGADCYITGEAGHHDALLSLFSGMSLITAGHYATEVPVVQKVAEYISGCFPKLKVVKSKINTNPFKSVR